jgi:hypothetical protein
VPQAGRHVAHPEHRGGLGRSEAGDVAQQKRGALARRQQLQRGDGRDGAHRTR